MFPGALSACSLHEMHCSKVKSYFDKCLINDLRNTIRGNLGRLDHCLFQQKMKVPFDARELKVPFYITKGVFLRVKGCGYKNCQGALPTVPIFPSLP